MRDPEARRPRRPRRRQPDTRERIADAALELFCTQGYGGTSVRELADRLEMTNAALYYHYVDKADILVEIVQPMLDDMDLLIDRANEGDFGIEQTLEGLFDLLVEHRAVFRLLYTDLAAGTHPAIAEQVRQHNLRLLRFVRGPERDEAARVRVAAVFGLLSRPVIAMPQVDISAYRDMLIEMAVRAFGPTPQRSRRTTTATRRARKAAK